MSQPIGSIWQSRDKRDNGKQVAVVAHVGLYGNRCRVVLPNHQPGRETTIIDKTLRSRYRLIFEPVVTHTDATGERSNGAARTHTGEEK